MDVIHGGEEGEVALVLDYSEGEARPLQRARDVDHVRANLVDRQIALLDRHEFDVSRIAHGMPDELSVASVFEPTQERIVPTKVCVDRLIHGGDIALACHVTAGNDLSGEVQALVGTCAVVA